MKSVERLVAEHDLIERGLSLLEDAIIKIEDGQALPDGFSAWVVRFFQQFADAFHHAKEEDVFFPVLKERGILEQGGPIGVMLYEHGLSRDCVSRMREASQAKPSHLIPASLSKLPNGTSPCCMSTSSKKTTSFSVWPSE